MPILPGMQFPGRYAGGEWKPMPSWQQYANRMATDLELDAWESWPGAGVGMCPGKLSGIIALDFDHEGNGAQAAIEAITPPSPVRKFGSKGYTAFYRYNGEHTQRFSIKGTDGKGERILDLLSDGSQTVLPPTVHPKGGHYKWLTVETLETIDFDALPTLPDNYSELVREVLAPYSVGVHESSGQPLGEEVPDYDISETEWRELAGALDHVPYQDYEQFVRVGMALRSIGGHGFKLWCEWAKRSPEFREGESVDYMRRKWAGFRSVDGGLTYESVFKWAREYGWTDPEVPDYAAQLLAGLQEKQKAVKRTGLHFLSVGQLGNVQPPEWLIKGHLTVDSLAMLYGPSGVGKSFISFDWGLSVAAGVKWQGFDVRKGGVLYICGEGKNGINARIRAWGAARGVDVEALPFLVSSQPVAFLDYMQVNELAEVMNGLPFVPALIIIDTLNRNFGDGDENNTKDMSRFVDALARLRAMTGACIMPVHHTGKMDTETARGNSSLRAALDTEISLTLRDGDLQLGCTKQKDAEQFTPVSLALDVVTVGTDPETGEDITSCVVGTTMAQEGAGLAQQLLEGKRAGKHQKTALALLREHSATFRVKNPNASFVSVAKRDLIDLLKGAGMREQARRRVITWLEDNRVLGTVTSRVFSIDQAAITAA
ncbi:hypothetical protein GCM10027297_36730 [Parahaliea aestuarii]